MSEPLNELILNMNHFTEQAEFTAPDFDPVEVLGKAQGFLSEEWKETWAAIKDNNVLEIVDGFADQAFLAINGIYKTLRISGQAPLQATENTIAILAEVTEANLRKGEGGFKHNENGKVIKPEGWMGPDHASSVTIG